MKAGSLIKMANQIADFFAAMPCREQAVQDMAAHIRRSWEARMLRDLLQHIEKNGDSDLSPLAREVFAKLEA
ncbi:MAG: formate dehydrogenase [Gallionellales bacterium CG03_land_8_20_14_0_80_55_15]|nr:MAG: formate dehydrogenase [Gallionellales bacterium CG03_land_8_20_14_0_80_55_15]PIX05415.1 MAG: formate dehydrogenase [Gallionellales bacterium CG_4_8_14_3_um_filter_54_18]